MGLFTFQATSSFGAAASSPITSTHHPAVHPPPLLSAASDSPISSIFWRLLQTSSNFFQLQLLTSCLSSSELPLHDNVTMSTANHQQPPRALRSTRVAANTARPLQPQNHSSSSHAAPASQLHHTQTTSATALGGPSSLSLFLRNLRLLDLDLLPDWPAISAETFAVTGPTSAAQGQKKRVQCVEWALFRLFSLWDPEETANVSRFPRNRILPSVYHDS